MLSLIDEPQDTMYAEIPVELFRRRGEEMAQFLEGPRQLLRVAEESRRVFDYAQRLAPAIRGRVENTIDFNTVHRALDSRRSFRAAQ